MAPRSPSTAGGGRGKWIAAALAVGVHLAFLLVLVFTVNWQNDRPEAVTAELYAPASSPAKPEPAPLEPRAPVEPPKPAPAPLKPTPEPPPRKVEAPPPPPPKVVPKVVPKAEPKVEAKPVLPSKADLALKDKQEQERRKKEQAERERKDQEAKAVARQEADKKQKDEQRVAQARERQAREAEALKAQAERERVASQRVVADAAKASTDAAKAKLDGDYKRRIQAKIRGNVNLPPDIPGNPEAIFEVVQLPTGEILDAQLRKSSGVRAYDEALHRAILRSSPLPQPESADLFQRNLVLRFRPLD